jgi:hypothetical protein
MVAGSVQAQESLRLGGAGVLSGLGVGIAAGLGARLVMRIVALDTPGRIPVFTGATIGLLEIVLSRCVVAGLLCVAIKRYLPGKGNFVKGTAFGGMLMMLFVTFFFWPPPSELLAEAHPLLGVSLFTALSLITGILVVTVVTRVERVLPIPRRSLPSVVGYGLLVLLGGLSLASFLAGDVAPAIAGLVGVL